MGENSHASNPQLTQKRNQTLSDDPRDGHKLTSDLGQHGGTAVEKAPADDTLNQATVEEFAEEGMGVAAKE